MFSSPPHGTDGWHLGIPSVRPGRYRQAVSALEFYRFRIQKRDEFNPLLYGRLLFQQYLTDMWANIESSRIEWHSSNQDKLRADLYRGLVDAVSAGDGDKAGRRVILPSSFTGGLRHMMGLYQDAMAIVRRFGKQDLFVTFTCNPMWPEIQKALEPGQMAVDRGDIVSRLFGLKKDALMDDIRNGAFGPLAAHCYTIEFQKSGLPHAHMLFILADEEDARVEIIDRLIAAEIERNEGGIVFIDAPSGTGKTYLLNLLLIYSTLNGKLTLATASSGIAATVLKSGTTAHSAFKLPIPANGISMCGFKRIDAAGRRIREASILVWDEAPMQHRWNLEALDRSFRDAIKESGQPMPLQPFGGKLLILSGDFRQLLPVVKRGVRAQIVNACITKSERLWSQTQIIHLTTNMRCERLLRRGDQESASQIQEYADWLLRLGEGRIPVAAGFGPNSNIVAFPRELILQAEINGQSEADMLIDHVYAGIEETANHTNPEWYAERGILGGTNKVIDEMNLKVLSRLPGDEGILLSADSVDESEQQMAIPTEFLNTLTPSGIPPHELRLKVNAPIMLLRNMSPKNGHCNGTRCIVTAIHGTRLIEAKIISGDHAANRILIPRIPMQPSDNDFPFTLKRRQFPVRPCFCMTVNKSQGQSFKRAGVYLPKPLFTHGQLYVAASRVGDPRAIRFVINQAPYKPLWQKQGVNVPYSWTRNIPQILYIVRYLINI